MPVSLLPIITPLVASAAIIWSAFRGRRAFLKTTGTVIGLLLLFLGFHYIPGWVLRAKAAGGDLSAQYRYARWLENHSERINQVILWPCSPQVLAGYRWLDQAAEKGHLPSLYMKGIRLKYGEHVPMPNNWAGPGGNHFPQPQLGQRFLDAAIEKGFRPLPEVEEEFYYWHVFRGLYHNDPNG